MRNFVVFFDGREGTTALMQLLSNFDQISVLHYDIKSGWEPFDYNSCGPISKQDLKECFNILFGNKPVDVDRFNQIYTKTAKKPVSISNPDGSIGFKMRFEPPDKVAVTLRRMAVWYKMGGEILKNAYNRSFENMMFDVLKSNNVAVFFAIRQDVLRWALSIYHGDGTGKRGNLQWKLASGKISREEIGKIHIDCKRLEKIILRCEESLAIRHKLKQEFEQKGIKVYPLLYEDFVQDKLPYFQRVCEILEIPLTEEEIKAVINQGAYFKKVHSDKLSGFVENHEEVMEKFGNRFVSWK